MKSNNKIVIAFDTNLLYKSGKAFLDFSSFTLNSRFQDLVDFIEKNDLLDNIDILISRVVIEELKKQQLEKFRSQLDSIRCKSRQFRGIYNINDIFNDIEYKTSLDDIYKSYFDRMLNSHVSVQILDYPTKERFYELIERAIDKKPPFKGTGNESDKGFKDALIWESIKEYEFSESVELLIMYSSDSEFSKLRSEFENKFGIKYRYIKDDKELFHLISEELSVIEVDSDKLRTSFLSDEIKSSKLNDDIIEKFPLIVEINGYRIININSLNVSDDSYYYEFNLIIESLVILSEDEIVEKELNLVVKFKMDLNNENYKITSIENSGEFFSTFKGVTDEDD